MLTCDLELGAYRLAVAETKRTINLKMREASASAAIEGAQEAKRAGRYKDRTGKLRSSIVARLVRSDAREVIWDILSPTRYSKFIESGTRPHPIYPRRANFLRFKIGERTIFARYVNHPGTKPYPFMGPGFIKAEQVMYRVLGTMLVDIESKWS